MFMRRRPLLRAAAVGGTAYVAGRHMANKSSAQAQQEDEQNERIDDLEQQAPAPAPAAAAAPAAGPSLLDQLNQLDALHQQGALTDNEFTAAKAKLLG
jgi:outer membrane murein-binding lipoprotein Lpp